MGFYNLYTNEPWKTVLPSISMAGKAIQYFLNDWDVFKSYIEDGRLPIDNNLAENVIIPFCVSRTCSNNENKIDSCLRRNDAHTCIPAKAGISDLYFFLNCNCLKRRLEEYAQKEVPTVFVMPGKQQVGGFI